MENQKYTYPKQEKLKSRTLIDLLFSEGKTVTKYPLRLVYMPLPDTEKDMQTGVSVSKKYFKKAVDRNYYKRVLRETYRHNKHVLTSAERQFVFMFLYQTRDRLSFEEINTKTVQLFHKFLLQENLQPQDNAL